MNIPWELLQHGAASQTAARISDRAQHDYPQDLAARLAYLRAEADKALAGLIEREIARLRNGAT